MAEPIVEGGTYRRSRFHDEKGNRVDAGGLIHAPKALISALLRALFGYRAEVPMISYRATAVIAGRLGPEMRGVEFGSGLSTPWLAKRCGFLLSLENDPVWHGRVQARLTRHGFTHVRHELVAPEDFHQIPEDIEGEFDFALIDGWNRTGCVETVVPRIKPGGWVYLDNSDKDMTRPEADFRRADERLRELAAARGARITDFTDFAPGNFFAEQGMLVEFLDRRTP